MNEPRVVESVTNECQSLGRAHESPSARAEQLIACLEGEIAKRDARIDELESRYQRDVYGLNNEGDPIGGDPAGGYANDNARLRTELAAIKAQEPVEYQLRALIRDVTNIPEAGYYMPQSWHDQVIALSLSGKLDAPVSEAKAQGVVLPDRTSDEITDPAGYDEGWNACLDEVARLNAAPAAPAADAGIVDMYRHLQKVTPYRFKKIQDASITDGGDVMYFHKDRFDAALLADMAAHCAAKGVV